MKIAAKIKTENELSKLLLNVYHLTSEFDGDVSGNDVTTFFSGANKNVRISSIANLSESIGDPFESDPLETSSEVTTKVFDVDLDHDADAILTVSGPDCQLIRNSLFKIGISVLSLAQDQKLKDEARSEDLVLYFFIPHLFPGTSLGWGSVPSEKTSCQSAFPVPWAVHCPLS